MSTYYCHPCAAKLGHLQNVYTSGVLQSPYQLDKFIKHTLPGVNLKTAKALGLAIPRSLLVRANEIIE